MFSELTGYLQKALKMRHTGSALSSLLWLNGIISVPCILLSAFIGPPMNIAFFGLAMIIVLYTMWQYQELRKADPRLLQSEKLQFEMAKLELVAKKGGEVVFDPVAIEFSAEPEQIGRATGNGEEE